MTAAPVCPNCNSRNVDQWPPERPWYNAMECLECGWIWYPKPELELEAFLSLAGAWSNTGNLSDDMEWGFGKAAAEQATAGKEPE